MATRYIGSTSTQPRNFGDIVFAASGGTLDASNTIQLNFDDTIYTATPEGKERLMNALVTLTDRLRSAKVWPVTTSS